MQAVAALVLFESPQERLRVWTQGEDSVRQIDVFIQPRICEGYQFLRCQPPIDRLDEYALQRSFQQGHALSSCIQVLSITCRADRHLQCFPGRKVDSPPLDVIQDLFLNVVQ